MLDFIDISNYNQRKLGAVNFAVLPTYKCFIYKAKEQRKT